MNNLKGFRYLAIAIEFEEKAGVDMSMSVLGSRHNLVGSVFVLVGYRW